MADDRTLALAKRIKKESENKIFNWIKSSNTYRLSLGNGMIMLELNYTNTLRPYYTFSVVNDRNTIIDSLTVDSRNPDTFNLMKDIYEQADMRYLKKDETYLSMFDALDLPF